MPTTEPKPKQRRRSRAKAHAIDLMSLLERPAELAAQIGRRMQARTDLPSDVVFEVGLLVGVVARLPAPVEPPFNPLEAALALQHPSAKPPPYPLHRRASDDGDMRRLADVELPGGSSDLTP